MDHIRPSAGCAPKREDYFLNNPIIYLGAPLSTEQFASQSEIEKFLNSLTEKSNESKPEKIKHKKESLNQNVFLGYLCAPSEDWNSEIILSQTAKKIHRSIPKTKVLLNQLAEKNWILLEHKGNCNENQ